MRRLDGRVAIVTGAADGIGRGVARVLASEGARVVVADVDAEGGERAAAELRAEGGEALAVAVDVADRAAVDAMAAVALERYGTIDVLVANAGVYRWDRLLDISDEVWSRIMDVNVKGALHCLQACVPAMRGQGYGRIVLVSSITGPVVATPDLAHYASSKAAMLGLMRSVALELVRDGITVNAVLPGNIRTSGSDRMPAETRAGVLAAIPLGRFGEPEEVGWAVRFLAAEEAGYVTGQTLVVDGGQVLPELRS